MEERNNIKNLIITTLIIMVILGVFYFVTILIMNYQTNNNLDNNTEAVIDYETILVSDIKQKNHGIYYVFVTMNDEEKNEYSSNLISYSEQDNALPVYYVDLNSAFNKNYISESTVLNTEIPTFNETTLLKVENKEITESYQGEDISTFIATLISQTE